MVAGQRPAATIGAVVLAIVGGTLLALVALRWSPAVPANAAEHPVGQTVLTGPIASDIAEGTDIAEVPRSPAGGACVPRVERAAGYMDVCWSAHRHPADSDPDKDYYVLEVVGTFGAGRDGPPRWAVLKADLVGSPADNVLSAWPDGEIDGECEQMPVSLPLVDPGTEAVLCGHIDSGDFGTWGRHVTWTCRGCLLPDDRDRALSLYVEVGVPANSVPVWELFADVGG